MATLAQMRRKRTVNKLRRTGVPMRKRKFLRKYTRGLSSPDKIYAFKRIAQQMSIQNITNTGVALLDVTQPNVVGYTNSIQVGTIVDKVNDVGSAPMTMTFRLSDVQNSTDFTSLFDQYKISGVKVKITWTCTEAASGSGVPAPRLMYCIDQDDATTPTQAELRQKNDLKIHQFSNGVPLVVYVKPKASNYLYNDGLASAYGPIRQFIDCGNPYVPHYAIKGFLQDLWVPVGNEYAQRSKFQVDVFYYLKLKGVQ